MTPETPQTIPASVLRWLDEVPHDAAVAVLMRHSARGHLPPGEAGNVVPITEAGERVATDLGRRLSARIRSLYTSPLLRCVQTAEALRRGAGVEVPIVKDCHLGAPGVYVIDPSEAGCVWDSLGHERVMQHLVSGTEALPGMAHAQPAARFLVEHMLGVADGRAGLHVFVTHDSLVTATAARLLETQLTKDDWPSYLEAAFFWRTGGDTHITYRDARRTLAAERLCGLDAHDEVAS